MTRVNFTYTGALLDYIIANSGQSTKAALGTGDRVISPLHTGDDWQVHVAVPVQLLHDADLKYVAHALRFTMLTVKLPRPICTFGFMCISIWVNSNLKGGIQE